MYIYRLVYTSVRYRRIAKRLVVDFPIFVATAVCSYFGCQRSWIRLLYTLGWTRIFLWLCHTILYKKTVPYLPRGSTKTNHVHTKPNILVCSTLEFRTISYVIWLLIWHLTPRYRAPVPGVLIVWRVCMDPNMPHRLLARQPWSWLVFEPA